MLTTITGGNTLKHLHQILQIQNGFLNYYKLTAFNTLVIPVYINKFDVLNNIVTTILLTPQHSIYLYKYFITSLMVRWARIIFRGKGFRIRNFQEDLKLTLNFGHSHWTRIKFFKYWYFWKIKRQNYIIVTFSLNYFEQFKQFFPTIKVFNRYTRRGLRLKKQPLIKRFGKLSQHISSLH